MRKKKPWRKLIITLLVLAVIFIGLNILKYFFLQQVQNQIKKRFSYRKMSLAYFPPTLVLEEVRTHSLEPFFSARRIIIKVSYPALLKRERPITIFLSQPEIRVPWRVFQNLKKEHQSSTLVLPVAIEKGVVQGGKVVVAGEDSLIILRELNAFFNQKQGEFAAKLKTGLSDISISRFSRPIQGTLNLSIVGGSQRAEIRKLVFQGKEEYFKGEGKINKFSPLEMDFKGSFKVSSRILTSFLGRDYQLEGDLTGEMELAYSDKEWVLRSSGQSPQLWFRDGLLGEAGFNFRTENLKKGEIDIRFRSLSQGWQQIRVEFSEDAWQGRVKDLKLDPLMKFIRLPWPVNSSVTGEFNYRRGKLTSRLEFKDELVLRRKNKFPFQGEVNLEFIPNQSLTLRSTNLQSSFAQMAVQVDLKFKKSVVAEIRGKVTDISQARHFTSLALQRKFPFPEIQGAGEVQVRIFGSPLVPRVFMAINAQPGRFADFQAQRIVGEAEVINNDFFGRFETDDPRLKARIGVVVTPEETRVDLRLDSGYLEDILPPLQILIPLEGKGQGEFVYLAEGVKEKFSGEFAAEELQFSGQKLSNVRGSLNWEDNVFSLDNLEFNLYEGKLTGHISFSQLKEIFDVEIQGQGLKISSLIPNASGEAHFQLKGKGKFSEDEASGKIMINDLIIYPFQPTDFKGDILSSFSATGLRLEIRGNFNPENNPLQATFNIPFREGNLRGSFEGQFTNYDLLLPWRGGRGVVKYFGEIKSEESSPQVMGAIELKGDVLPLAKFAHALRSFTGLIFFQNGHFELRSLQGKMGGGQLFGWGEMNLGREGIRTLDVKVKGQDLLLSPWERTRALGNAELALIKNDQDFVLNGNIFVKQLLWQREVTEKLSFYSEPYLTERPKGFFDDLDLNLKIKAEDNAWVENSLARLRARFDLQVVGNIFSPILLGEIETLDGNIYFQDRTFKVLKGRIGFYNPAVIEPYISFTGETYVKDYRVTFSLEGLLERMTPEFSSSPPLPPEDVLALLALGESFQRTYSYDRSSQLSTAAFLSFQLSEEAKKRAEKLFSLDRFRIDPFVMGASAEMTARLTLGKKISRNFSLLYSTNLTSQREELTRLEWEILSDVSVVGMRDENGRISIEVKIHKRF